MSRVLCRRGVSRGALSHGFSADQLLDALNGGDSGHVYMELDSGGWLSEAGGRGGRGAARLCAGARLAPHVAARGADVALCAAASACGAAALRLRAAADLAPHAEMLLWFADDALAALDMPFLTLRNIRGRRDYECHYCHAGFDDPNPLKVHLFLSCAPYEPRAFWREVAARLERAAPPPPPPALRPAELEALATEWGRSREGHLCLYCGKLYSRRYGLKIHLRTHTGYRPLRCRYCARAFGDPSNLNKHVRLHAAAERPELELQPHDRPPRYRCAHCGRALARRRDLERHVRTHAPTLALAHTHTPVAGE